MDNRYDRIWVVSLFVMAVAAIVSSGAKLVGIVLPDNMKRFTGVIELAALAVFVFSTVKRFKSREK